MATVSEARSQSLRKVLLQTLNLTQNSCYEKSQTHLDVHGNEIPKEKREAWRQTMKFGRSLQRFLEGDYGYKNWPNTVEYAEYDLRPAPEWFTHRVRLSDQDETKIAFPPDEAASESGRLRTTSVSKFLTFLERQFGITMDARLRETFQSEMVQFLTGTSPYSHELVSGPEVVVNYDASRSCMSHFGYMSDSDSDEGYELPSGALDRHPSLQLYAANPDKIQLVVFRESGKKIGRALLWTCDDGSLVLDRVYPSGRGALDLYVSKIVEANGWLHRDDDIGKRWATLKNVNAYPYMDTFRNCHFERGEYEDGKTIIFSTTSDIGLAGYTGGYYCQMTNNLSPHSDEYGDVYYFDRNGEVLGTLDSTERGSRYYCAHCDERTYEDDLRSTVDGSVCESCIEDHYVWVETYRRSNGYYVYADYFRLNDCVSDVDGNWFLRQDSVETYDGYWTLRSRSVELYDGQYADEDDSDVYTLHDGRGALAGDENLVTLYDGDHALRHEVVELELGEHEGEYALRDDCIHLEGDGDTGWILRFEYRFFPTPAQEASAVAGD